MPRLTQALLAAPGVARGWNAIPGTDDLTRFDGLTPVRTMPELDAYLREDLIRVLVAEREHFETLAGGQPSVDALAPLMLATGLFVMLYGGVMMRFVARRY